MFKKSLLAVLATTLVLTSCGKPQIGEFNEELNAQLSTYSNSIDKYFDNALKYTVGKSSGDFGIKADFSSPMGVKGELNLAGDMKAEADENISMENLAFAMDFNLDGKMEVTKTDEPTLKELEGGKVSGNAKASLAMVGGVIYAKLNAVDFKAEGNENLAEASKEIDTYKAQINEYLNKWFSIDYSKLAELQGEDISLTINTKEYYDVAKNFTKSVFEFLASDIYKDVQKVEKNGKEAYKFSFDKEKVANELPNALVNSIADFAKMMGEEVTEEDLNDIKEQIKESILDIDEQSFKSEIYLVKTSKDHSDLIYEVTVVDSYDVESKINFSILDKGFDFVVENDEMKLALNANGSLLKKLNYVLSFVNKDENVELLKATGDYKVDFGTNKFEEKLTGKVVVNDKEDSKVKEIVTVNFEYFQNPKKDENVNLSLESVTNNEEVTSLDHLFENVYGMYGDEMDDYYLGDEEGYFDENGEYIYIDDEYARNLDELGLENSGVTEEVTE